VQKQKETLQIQGKDLFLVDFLLHKGALAPLACAAGFLANSPAKE
jgi:hypothetical protein